MKQLFVVLLLSVVANSSVVGCAGILSEEKLNALWEKANETQEQADWDEYNALFDRKEARKARLGKITRVICVGRNSVPYCRVDSFGTIISCSCGHRPVWTPF